MNEALGRFSGASLTISDERVCAGITHNLFNRMHGAFGWFSGASAPLLDERPCAKIRHNAFNTITESLGDFHCIISAFKVAAV